MKRIVLDNTISLNAVMSGAPAANQPTYTVAWADKSSGSPFVPGFDRGSLNGTTEVTLVSSPASGTDRVIRSFSIVNIDTADVTITLYTDDASTEVEIAPITLSSGDILTEDGVYDSNGNLKQVITYAGTVVTLDDAQTLTNKTLTNLNNTIYADQVHVVADNETGSTIAKGKPVFASGYNVGQDEVEITLADATDVNKMPAIGITFEEITTGSTGAVTREGIIEGLDTSSFSVGDVLYVSETAGELTATKPATAGSLIQPIAIVTRSNAGSGVIQVIAMAADVEKANISGGNIFLGDQEFEDNIGIGGASSAQKLEIYGQSNTSRARLVGNSTVILDISAFDVQGRGVMGTNSNHPFHFITNNNDRLIVDTSGNIEIQDGSLDVKKDITIRELSADPADPDEGASVIWMSDGTGTGDDGDILRKITAGGVTKLVTVHDFSAL